MGHTCQKSEFAPLGDTVIEVNFDLKLPYSLWHIQKIHTFPEFCWIVWYRPHLLFKLLPGNFTSLHQTLHTSSVDTLDKKIIKNLLIFQRILKLLNKLPADFARNRKCSISPQWCVRMTWNSDYYFPMSPFTTRWHSLDWSTLYIHIGRSD